MTGFGLRLLACATATVAIGAGAQTPKPSAEISPSAAVAKPSVRMLQRWMPGEVRCGDQPVAALRILRPYSNLLWSEARSLPQTYLFRVDETGRPLSITRKTGEWAPWTEDIGPSLAASRFARGTPLSGCAITYTSDTVSLADAPAEDLIAYKMTPLTGRLPEEAWARIRSDDGGDCDRPPLPQWLTAALPDYAKLPGEPGVRDWSLVGYDLDAAGRPKGVRHVAGTGNPALDKAAMTALSRSRLAGGARTGCRSPYLRRASLLVMPSMIDPATIRPEGANCPQDYPWARKPVLTYPPAFRRRSIEGWAVIGFDVAPWGGTGNLRILASEPAQAFGEQARTIIGAATKAASPTGYTGCVDRVRFVMGAGVLSAEPETGDTQSIM